MAVSRKLAIAGLLLLSGIAPWWLTSAYAEPGFITVAGLGALPPIALAVATWKRTRNWSGITALGMIPYAALGTMDIVASSGAMVAGLILATVAIVTFFLVLDAGKRDG